MGQVYILIFSYCLLKNIFWFCNFVSESPRWLTMLARSPGTPSLNAMIIYPEILGHSYSRFDILKSITIASFHLVHGWNKGEGHATYRLCVPAYYVCVPSWEPLNWNVTGASPFLMIFYNFSKLNISSCTFSCKVKTDFPSRPLW